MNSFMSGPSNSLTPDPTACATFNVFTACVAVKVVVSLVWYICEKKSSKLRTPMHAQCKLFFLSKTSQIIFDLHPGFSHMEDEKGSKLHRSL